MQCTFYKNNNKNKFLLSFTDFEYEYNPENYLSLNLFLEIF